jgi:hypothetical protein
MRSFAATTTTGETAVRNDPPPGPEPLVDPPDMHVGPLDSDDDARYLDPVDPRRLDVERRRGRPFNADDA